MKKKVCEHCRCTFFPSRSNQKFCTNQTCRGSRKRQWQSKKVRTDEDYRAAQKEAHARWLEKNPDYYRNYRKRNSTYTRCNQLQQRVRNRCRRGVRSSQFHEKIAKMETKRPVVTGIYQLVAVGPDGNLIAKMDASYVQLTELQTLTVSGP